MRRRKPAAIRCFRNTGTRRAGGKAASRTSSSSCLSRLPEAAEKVQKHQTKVCATAMQTIDLAGWHRLQSVLFGKKKDFFSSFCQPAAAWQASRPEAG